MMNVIEGINVVKEYEDHVIDHILGKNVTALEMLETLGLASIAALTTATLYLDHDWTAPAILGSVPLVGGLNLFNNWKRKRDHKKKFLLCAELKKIEEMISDEGDHLIYLDIKDDMSYEMKKGSLYLLVFLYVVGRKGRIDNKIYKKSLSTAICYVEKHSSVDEVVKKEKRKLFGAKQQIEVLA